MDRELALCVLVFAIVGSACFVCGMPKAELAAHPSGRMMERVCWRRLWLPWVPGSLLLAALVGWEWQEPRESEPLCFLVELAAIPFAIVWLRAILRAGRAALDASGPVAVGTRGLLKPAIVMDPELVAELDAAALRAAIAHERAHARHFDPLRIWCAQFITDLQWPAPGAKQRLSAWRRALELARDEEARALGAEGPDLAAAIVHVASMPRRTASATAAALTGSQALEDRVARLLRPVVAPPSAQSIRLVLWLVGGLLAVTAGRIFGESLVRALATAS